MSPPTKGQKRTKQLPNHIDGEKLPHGVEYVASGHGFFRLRYIDEETGKRKYKRLCDSKASLSQIWALAETKEETKVLTFTVLSQAFQNSPDWRKLSSDTKKDYAFCHKAIVSTKTKTGVLFGETPISKWTIGTVLKYRDKRGESSISRANKELAYIKRVLAWAKLYEKIGQNIATGVPRLTLKARKHYAEDKHFDFFLQVARESQYWYMEPLIIITFECALRLCEAVDLTDARETEQGLKIIGRKGSNTNIIEWGKNLKDAWEGAKQKRNKILTDKKLPLQIDPEKRFLFISEKTGDRLKEKAIKTAKNRLDQIAKEKAEKLGIHFVPFTLHDIKKKSVTDTKGNRGDKKDKSRHKTEAMVELYDLSIKTAKPTSDD